MGSTHFFLFPEGHEASIRADAGYQLSYTNLHCE